MLQKGRKRTSKAKPYFMGSDFVNGAKESKLAPFWRLIFGIQNKVVRELDVGGRERFAVVKRHTFAQSEQIRSLIEHLPAFGQFRPQPRILVRAQKRVINQCSYTHRISICGIARVEMSGIAFDTYYDMVRRPVR